MGLSPIHLFTTHLKHPLSTSSLVLAISAPMPLPTSSPSPNLCSELYLKNTNLILSLSHLKPTHRLEPSFPCHLPLPSHPLLYVPSTQWSVISKAYVCAHTPPGCYTCYFFHPESTSHASLPAKILLGFQNPAERSLPFVRFSHLSIAEMFIKYFLCARLSSGCWICPCPGCLFCAAMTSLCKSGLNYFSRCSLIFAFFTWPFAPQDWAPRGWNDALFILAQHPFHRESWMNVYWLLTNDEEQQSSSSGCMCAYLSLPDSWVWYPNTLSALLAAVTQLSPKPQLWSLPRSCYLKPPLSHPLELW